MNDIPPLIDAAVRFIREKSTANAEGVSLSRFFWADEKKWNPTEAEWDDIGDYHTFVAWYGVEFNDSTAIQWVKQQIKWWHRHLRQPNGLLISLWRPEKKYPKPSNWHPLSFYDHHDAFLGIEVLHRLTQDSFYLQIFEALGNVALEYIDQYNGLIPNRILPALHCALPNCTASPTVGGLIAEELCHLSERKKDPRYRKGARKILKAWIGSPLFRTKKLFALGYYPYVRYWSPYSHTFLMKENTNMVYALLEYLQYEQDFEIQQALEEWFAGLHRFKQERGGYVDTYDIARDCVRVQRIDKTHNFALIEAFIQGALVLQKPALLEEAKALADFWISFTGSTGLIPEYINPQGVMNRYAKLDQSSDLAIAFLKLAEATGEGKYKEAAQKTKKALAHFVNEEGWWHRLIDIDTGKVPDEETLEKSDRPGGRNLTKYVGGALKFLVALYKIEQEATFKEDPHLESLTRDR